MLSASFPVYQETYASQLGQFKLEIASSNTLFSIGADAAGLHTVGHDIGITRMHPPLEWLPAHMPVEMAAAWLFYITKRNSSQEQLVVSMGLLNDHDLITTGAETGQNLVAVGFEDGFRQIHLGTEDEEAMAQRAAANNWMPPRFEKLLRPSLRVETPIEFTTITPNGLRTQIPHLEPGERFYFHYIIAENPCRQAVDCPDEMDISTWFAVEQTKHQLETSWQAITKQP